MNKFTVFLSFLLPLAAKAQTDSMQSGLYAWKEPGAQKSISSAVLFEGKVQDMQWLQMSANKLTPSKARNEKKIPADEEHLMIIKSGRLRLIVKDSTFTIGAGSVALLLPGENYSLQNRNGEPCKFYLMKYRSKLPADIERGKSVGGALVTDWNNVVFKPHDKGGRRDFFERPTAMCRRMEMHVSTLNPGLKSHDPHTHRAEEIVLVTEGNTEMQIRDGFYKGSAGSIYYLGSNVPHAVQNNGTKPCTYFAFQFE